MSRTSGGERRGLVARSVVNPSALDWAPALHWAADAWSGWHRTLGTSAIPARIVLGIGWTGGGSDETLASQGGLLDVSEHTVTDECVVEGGRGCDSFAQVVGQA
jgi:hypothetical protein